MNKLTTVLLALLIFTGPVLGSRYRLPQQPDPYKTSGKPNYTCDSIRHPGWEKHCVYLFYPSGAKKSPPVVFFCHGISAYDPQNYQAFIEHIVGRGFAVIYSPFPTVDAMFFPRKTYHIMWSGFAYGVKTWKKRLDLENIGIVGHSYGAGASPYITLKASFRQWGKKSLFMYSTAPWYIHGVSSRRLKHFPENAKVIVEVFEDDRVNDHRIAKDLYNAIGLPVDRKMFLILNSSRRSKTLVADHDVPRGSSAKPLDINELDRFGIYAVFDLVSSFSYEKDSTSADIFAHNRNEKIISANPDSLTLTRLVHPEMIKSQEFCLNFWDHAMNPRIWLYRRMSDPVRMVFQTPVTILNYTILAYEYVFHSRSHDR